MARPDGKLDYKQIGQVVIAALAIVGGGSGVYATATTKVETSSPAELVERVIKLESWKESHVPAERESRIELTAAIRENTKELGLFREAIVTQISEQAATIRVVEARVTALERRQERIR